MFESFSSSTSLPKFGVVILFNLAIPGGVKLYLILVLIYISLRPNDFKLHVLTGHHFLCSDRSSRLLMILLVFGGFFVNDVRVLYIFCIKVLCYRYIVTVLS